MKTLWRDLRYGVRMLVKRPGLTLIATLSLALGIGANTSMFSVVNALFLRQLPVPEPGELMFVFSGTRNSPWGRFLIRTTLITATGTESSARWRLMAPSLSV